MTHTVYDCIRYFLQAVKNNEPLYDIFYNLSINNDVATYWAEAKRKEPYIESLLQQMSPYDTEKYKWSQIVEWVHAYPVGNV
jgi:hypothetical protein